MSHTVYLKKSAEKELRDLPAKIHDRIITVLLSLKDAPSPATPKSFTAAKA